MKKVQEPDTYVQRWLSHGVDRSVVKRSVMTTPYGITRRSAVTYVVEDYLSKGKCPLFEKSEYFQAAQSLLNYAWPAIADVVVKSREAMDWLKSSARRIIEHRGDDTEGMVTWVTPSGFLASQSYYEIQEHRIKTRLHGTTRLVVVSEGDHASVTRHASGLAPNFVHSMDASHMHLTAAAAARCGIDALAMIHDDFGTHAADAQQLYTLIRVKFLDMYTENDPIADFAALYPECPKPPAKGNLDLKEVLYSEYFFS
jgi:DNA-directed RNA polymerase